MVIIKFSKQPKLIPIKNYYECRRSFTIIRLNYNLYGLGTFQKIQHQCWRYTNNIGIINKLRTLGNMVIVELKFYYIDLTISQSYYINLKGIRK